MKILSCPTCTDGLAKTLDGRPYWALRFPGPPGQPYRFKCSGCRTLLEITMKAFGELPHVNQDDLGSAAVPLADSFRMGVLTREQGMDLLLQTRFTVRELEAVSASQEGRGAATEA